MPCVDPFKVPLQWLRLQRCSEASLLVVMLSAIALGIALTAVRPGLLHRPWKAGAEENEASYYIRRSRAATKPIPLLWPMMKLAVVVLFLWLLPFPLFNFFCWRLPFLAGPRAVLHENLLSISAFERSRFAADAFACMVSAVGVWTG